MPRFPFGSGRRGGVGGSRAQSRRSESSRHTIYSAWKGKNPPVAGYDIAWADSQPVNVYTSNTHPSVTFVGKYDSGGIIKVQVQWANFLSGFSSYDASRSLSGIISDYTIDTVTSGSSTTTTCPAELGPFIWYVRARAGDGTVWSSWTPPIQVSVYSVVVAGAFYIDENVGQSYTQPHNYAAAYIDFNVGMLDVPKTADALYIDENIGASFPLPLAAIAAYVDENVGLDVNSTKAATAYMDVDIDSSAHPTPHIWWIVPVQGREGWLFHLYGHGFGDQQSEFGGRVLINDIQAGVIEWERVAASLQQNHLSLTLKPGSTVGSILKVLLNAPTGITVQTGDRIVWEEYWESPTATNLGFGLSFTVGGTEYGSNTDAARTDDAGMLLRAGTDRTPAYGTWLRRSYTIQSSDNNDALGSFYFYSIAQSTTQVLMTVRLRNVGVLSGTDSTAKWWAVPPTIVSFTPPAPVTAQNGAAVDSVTIYSPDVMIDPASGLVDQTILPEHGHIVVSVPEGAESGPVKVRLTI